MIKLSEGELLDLLPSGLKNDTDMICLSYALKCAVERLLNYEMMSMTMNFIDMLPEEILDVLAVEWRSAYYLQSMDIEVKRSIIKNTFVWYVKAGTASVVSEMITAIFGEGYLVEWPDFEDGEGEPGTFDIVTNAQLTETILDDFAVIIDRVKNVRSHLRNVLIARDLNAYWYSGVGVVSTPKVPVTNSPQLDKDMESQAYIAAGAISSPKEKITNNAVARSRETSSEAYIAAGAISSPKEIIGNTMASASRSLQSTENYAAVGAMSIPYIKIQ